MSRVDGLAEPERGTLLIRSQYSCGTLRDSVNLNLGLIPWV